MLLARDVFHLLTAVLPREEGGTLLQTGEQGVFLVLELSSLQSTDSSQHGFSLFQLFFEAIGEVEQGG